MKFELSKLPKKISPCPIAQSLVEIRFEPAFPPEVITGMVFNKFKGLFPDAENLPIMNIPQFVRDSDPNLKYAAQIVLKNKDFQLQIGPRAVSLMHPKEYQGWTAFSKNIDEIFKGLNELAIIKQPTRMGLRYISFFEKFDVFSNLNIDIKLASNSIIGNNNIIRSEFKYDDLVCVVQLVSDAMLNNVVPGSSIDIDIIKEINDESIWDQYRDLIDRAHNLEKQIFFSLLKSEFLEKLNPEY